PHQVVLVEVVVEHVLGGLAQVDDPFAQRRRLDPEGHLLGVVGAGGVVVAADAADAAGDEVGIARILALHEDAVAAEQRAGRAAVGDALGGEVNLGVDAEVADDAGHGVEVHLDQAAVGGSIGGGGRQGGGRHLERSGGGFLIAGGQRRPLVVPLGLLVGAEVGDAPQGADGAAVGGAHGHAHARARRLVHEGHELVGEAGHGAGHADAADVGTAADAVHPAALGDVAIDHRPPAAELDQAFGRAVLVGEIRLLVVPGPVAALVHGLAEQPGGPQLVVQGDDGGHAGDLVEQVGQRLHEVIGLHRAAGDIDHRQPRLRAPAPAQVVGQPHGSGRVAGHGVDAAVGGAGADGDGGQGVGG